MKDKVIELTKDKLSKLGFNIVSVNITGTVKKTIEFFIERIDRGIISVGDCRLASKNISVLLDVDCFSNTMYSLHVASCGVERPLLSLIDFKNHINYDAKVRFNRSVNDVSVFIGEIICVIDDEIVMRSKDLEIRFEYITVKKANLILTDKKFRELLK